MEERDYYKREIDLLGRVLAKLLNDLIGQKNNGGLRDGIKITDQVLKDELDLDIEFIATTDKNIVDFLKTEKELNDFDLEKIAEIILLNLEYNDQNKISDKIRVNLYTKCLEIYEHIQKNDNTYSLERDLKIQNIKSILSN